MKRGEILAILLIPVLFGVAVVSQNHLDRYLTPERELQETVHLPDGKVLKVISLGYNSLLADILWIRSVLYFGKHTLDEDNPYYAYLARQAGQPELEHHHAEEEEHEHHHEHQLLEHLKHQGTPVKKRGPLDLAHDPNLRNVLVKSGGFDLAPYIYPILWRVVELDPHFVYPFLFGGFTVLHETGKVDEAYALLQYGRRYNPDRWEFPFYLGYIDLFYRGETRQALQWLAQALALPGHPEFLEGLYVSLTRATSQTEHVVEYLRAMYRSTRDPKTREQILKILRELASGKSRMAAS